MKKLDKLILKSFLGPFVLTFLVAVFILLIQYMLKYFDDFVGKNLGIGVFGELMMYFSVNMMPLALPLAVLVSSLMTYGKLGEHFELTAIKSSGISLIRVLVPTFVFVVLLSVVAFYINNTIVPSANLKAFSLLYDIKQTKPALDLKEGQFYAGLPGYSIKVKKKHKDGVTMEDVVIYDHTNTTGNKKVIIADSCLMYTINNERYLVMELFDGNRYIEEDTPKKKRAPGAKGKEPVHINRFVRTSFDRMEIVFSLTSFGIKRSDDHLFAGNRYMKSVKKLTQSVDSMNYEKNQAHFKMFNTLASLYKFHHHGYIEPPKDVVKMSLERDSLREIRRRKEEERKALLDTAVQQQEIASTSTNEKPKWVPREIRDEQLDKGIKPSDFEFTKDKIIAYTEEKKQSKLSLDSAYLDSLDFVKVKSYYDDVFKKTKMRHEAAKRAASNARAIKTSVTSTIGRFKYFDRSIDAHTVEKYKKYAQAFACIVMFLIGAPLGAIIKRGGLGLPIIISVFFFVIFYVLTSASDKWAKGGLMDGMYAAWVANAVLLPPGFFFLKQARKDAKLFDTDFYDVMLDRLLKWWHANKKNFRWVPGM